MGVPVYLLLSAIALPLVVGKPKLFSMTAEKTSLIVGETLNITCRLVINEKSSDLSFWWKNTALTENVRHGHRFIQVTVFNVTAQNNGSYFCRYKNRTTDSETIRILIGYPPAKPQNIKCVSRNLNDMICTWDPVKTVADLIVPTNWTVTYRILYKSDNQNCSSPSVPLSSVCPNASTSGFSCYWPQHNTDSRLDFDYVNYCLDISVENSLGKARSDVILITTEHIVRPNRVRFTSKPDSRYVVLNITRPIDLHLEYRIFYNSFNWSDSRALSMNSSELKHWSYTIGGLVPYSVYNISVIAKPIGSGYWSKIRSANITTLDRARPEAAPRVSRHSFTMVPITRDSRRLYVYWKPPDLRWMNGPIKGYKLRVMPVPGARTEQTIDTDDIDDKKVMLSVSKELITTQKYIVELYARNNHNFSQQPSTIDIPMTNDAAPFVSEISAELNNTDVIVSWKIPPDVKVTKASIHVCQGDITSDGDVTVPECKTRYYWVDIDPMLRSVSLDNNGTGFSRFYVFGIALENDGNIGGIKWMDCLFQYGKEPHKLRDVRTTADRQETVIPLRWNPITCGNLGRILHYEVSYWASDQHSVYSCDQGQMERFTGPWNLAKVTLDDLLPSTSYHVCVRAVTRPRNGPWSDMILARTDAPVPVGLIIALITIIVPLILCIAWFIKWIIRMKRALQNIEITSPPPVPNEEDYYAPDNTDINDGYTQPLIPRELEQENDSGTETLSRNSSLMPQHGPGEIAVPPEQVLSMNRPGERPYETVVTISNPTREHRQDSKPATGAGQELQSNNSAYITPPMASTLIVHSNNSSYIPNTLGDSAAEARGNTVAGSMVAHPSDHGVSSYARFDRDAGSQNNNSTDQVVTPGEIDNSGQGKSSYTRFSGSADWQNNNSTIQLVTPTVTDHSADNVSSQCNGSTNDLTTPMVTDHPDQSIWSYTRYARDAFSLNNRTTDELAIPRITDHSNENASSYTRVGEDGDAQNNGSTDDIASPGKIDHSAQSVSSYTRFDEDFDSQNNSSIDELPSPSLTVNSGQSVSSYIRFGDDSQNQRSANEQTTPRVTDNTGNMNDSYTRFGGDASSQNNSSADELSTSRVTNHPIHSVSSYTRFGGTDDTQNNSLTDQTVTPRVTNHAGNCIDPYTRFGEAGDVQNNSSSDKPVTSKAMDHSGNSIDPYTRFGEADDVQNNSSSDKPVASKAVDHSGNSIDPYTRFGEADDVQNNSSSDKPVASKAMDHSGNSIDPYTRFGEADDVQNNSSSDKPVASKAMDHSGNSIDPYTRFGEAGDVQNNSSSDKPVTSRAMNHSGNSIDPYTRFGEADDVQNNSSSDKPVASKAMDHSGNSIDPYTRFGEAGDVPNNSSSDKPVISKAMEHSGNCIDPYTRFGEAGDVQNNGSADELMAPRVKNHAGNCIGPYTRFGEFGDVQNNSSIDKPLTSKAMDHSSNSIDPYTRFGEADDVQTNGPADELMAPRVTNHAGNSIEPYTRFGGVGDMQNNGSADELMAPRLTDHSGQSVSSYSRFGEGSQNNSLTNEPVSPRVTDRSGNSIDPYTIFGEAGDMQNNSSNDKPVTSNAMDHSGNSIDPYTIFGEAGDMQNNGSTNEPVIPRVTGHSGQNVSSYIRCNGDVGSQNNSTTDELVTARVTDLSGNIIDSHTRFGGNAQNNSNSPSLSDPLNRNAATDNCNQMFGSYCRFDGNIQGSTSVGSPSSSLAILDHSENSVSSYSRFDGAVDSQNNCISSSGRVTLPDNSGGSIDSNSWLNDDVNPRNSTSVDMSPSDIVTTQGHSGQSISSCCRYDVNANPQNTYVVDMPSSEIVALQGNSGQNCSSYSRYEDVANIQNTSLTNIQLLDLHGQILSLKLRKAISYRETRHPRRNINTNNRLHCNTGVEVPLDGLVFEADEDIVQSQIESDGSGEDSLLILSSNREFGRRLEEIYPDDGSGNSSSQTMSTDYEVTDDGLITIPTRTERSESFPTERVTVWHRRTSGRSISPSLSTRRSKCLDEEKETVL